MKGGFVDTNVLVYAATGAVDETTKWERAYEVLAVAGHCASAQVLAEFYNIATRKHRLPVDEANQWMLYLDRLEIQPVDRAIVLAGTEISQRLRISYWDAAIVAAARRLQVDTLYTEDLNHEQDYDGVRVINPFI